jgi:hypothetical protein
MYLNVNSIEKRDRGGEEEGRRMRTILFATMKPAEWRFLSLLLTPAQRSHLSWIYNNKIINILSHRGE